jgi:hypothetical protein
MDSLKMVMLFHSLQVPALYGNRAVNHSSASDQQGGTCLKSVLAVIKELYTYADATFYV